MESREAIDVLTDKNTTYGTLKCDDMAWRKLKPAIDLAIVALEKQIPKKPKQGEPYTWIDSVRVKGRYKDVRKTSYRHVCSNCGENVAMDMSCCKYCGQAIDWSDTD